MEWRLIDENTSVNVDFCWLDVATFMPQQFHLQQKLNVCLSMRNGSTDGNLEFCRTHWGLPLLNKGHCLPLLSFDEQIPTWHLFFLLTLLSLLKWSVLTTYTSPFYAVWSTWAVPWGTPALGDCSVTALSPTVILNQLTVLYTCMFCIMLDVWSTQMCIYNQSVILPATYHPLGNPRITVTALSTIPRYINEYFTWFIYVTSHWLSMTRSTGCR